MCSKKYVVPSIRVWAVRCCLHVCESVVEVTFGAELDNKWDGERVEVELARKDNVWDEW